MKALIYTLVLVAILVTAVFYLRTLPQRAEKGPDETLHVSERLETPPTTVKSSSPVRSRINESTLDTANDAALFQTGCELFDLWHVEDAVKVFEALVARNPDDLSARMRLVECYAHPTISAEAKSRDQLQAGRDIAVRTGVDTLQIDALRRLFVDPIASLAVEPLTQLSKKNRHDIHVRLLLAEAYLMDRRPQEARAPLEKLLADDATLARARELLVQCHLMMGELEKAETLARDLAALYSEEPFPYVLLSAVLLIEGKIPKAIEFCNNALLIDNRYVPAIVARARLYTVVGQNDAARVAFEKLLLFDDPMLRAVGTEGVASVDFLAGRFNDATEGMDQAISLAMGAGSARQGLIYAFRLVDYLCELGRTDSAEAVLTRWVVARGDIPAHLGRLRVAIASGNLEHARAMLQQVSQDKRWLQWMRLLDLDVVQYQALAFIGEKRFGRALNALSSPGGEGVVGTRRFYLRGFALFQSGEAERAAPFFKQNRFRQHRPVFPYGADPIVQVQSTFFLAEAALARGQGEEARDYYEQFLHFWGNADWDLQAVARAREKLSTLAPQAPQVGG